MLQTLQKVEDKTF